MILVFASCADDSEQNGPDCNALIIDLKSKLDPTTCTPADGQVRVMVSGGAKPYLFRINNKSFQPDSSFTGLQGGSFIIEVVDINQCAKSLEVNLNNFSSGLSASAIATEDTGCLAGNGSLQVSPLGGAAPYQFKYLNTVSNNAELTDLKQGVHEVTVIDAEGCEFVLGVNVPRGNTSVSWATDIKPIIDTRCAKSTCHVPGTGRSDLSKFDNVKSLAGQIKTRTQNKSMPFDEPMPTDQIQLIACWVDDGANNN